MKQLISLMPFLVAVCIAQSGAPPRQQSAHMLDATTSPPVHLSYLLYLPATYAATRDTHWPLILYLHGGSLRGENVEQLRTLGLPHKLESEPDFPFVVVSPQCPAGEIWTDAEAIKRAAKDDWRAAVAWLRLTFPADYRRASNTSVEVNTAVQAQSIVFTEKQRQARKAQPCQKD